MERKLDPCIMVIFGATGDLTRRKLIPALYNLFHEGLLPEKFAVCAYARKQKDEASFRAELKADLEKYSRQKPEADWDKLAEKIFYVNGAFDDEAGFEGLKKKLAEIDGSCGTSGNRLHYLAVGSEYFVPVVNRLACSGLLVRTPRNVLNPNAQPWTRVVLEKPIGHDFDSAQRILTDVAVHASERQIFRIDHYLGKETVQNILALRFGNCIFEPVWNRKYIDHVQITVAEEEGVGTRAGYYEKAGALRDMIQNHVLQLLCLVAMEAPGTMGADDVRNEKVKILRNLRKMTPEQVSENTVRGQYGPSGDGKMPAYRAEAGVDLSSTTETYVAIRCFVDTWRWAGVPFLVRTGKRLPRRETEIAIHFRVPPLQLFENSPIGKTVMLTRGHATANPELLCCGNVLTLHIQPHEGASLEIAAKVPGSGMKLKNVTLDFDYADSFKRQMPEAYERLLVDAIAGDATLFTRDDEVMAQWEFINLILEGWSKQHAPRFPNYFAGTWGPDDSNRILPSCGPGWHLV